MIRYASIIACTTVALTGAAAAQGCATMGATELLDGLRWCVSSELGPQGGNDYGPDNLADGRDSTAWCEGVPGPGAGERVTLDIYGAGPFRQVLVMNGYQKDATTWDRNGRLRTVEIATDTGARFRHVLPDTAGTTIVPLPGLAPYRRIEMTVVDTYPGSRYADTCLSGFWPDLEFERSLEFQQIK